MGRTYGDEDEDFCKVVEEAVVNAAVSVKRDVSGRGMGLGRAVHTLWEEGSTIRRVLTSLCIRIHQSVGLRN